VGQRERQEAQILQQPTPGREWVGGSLRDAQIMDTAAVGVAQKGMTRSALTSRTFLTMWSFFLPL
jgi:hypothetical protein